MTTLLVAATGGHLKQLHHLRYRLWGVEPPFRWVTFDRPQSRSMLADEVVGYVPLVGTRDPLNAARALPRALRLLREDPDVTAVVSTGSAIALPYLAAARMRGLKSMYIESAARAQGPSVTGRMVGAIPGVELYTQYPAWADRRWTYRAAVFDVFSGVPNPTPPARIRSVVVTLGTMTYPFESLVRRLRRVLPADAEVLWQVGSTDVSQFGIEGVPAIPERELSDAMARADVVIAHAGVGSALAALEVGKVPVLVPRRESRGEHVDDHQEMIAGELQRRGLAVLTEVDQLHLGHLEAAAGRAVQAPV